MIDKAMQVILMYTTLQQVSGALCTFTTACALHNGRDSLLKSCYVCLFIFYCLLPGLWWI